MISRFLMNFGAQVIDKSQSDKKNWLGFTGGENIIFKHPSVIWCQNQSCIFSFSIQYASWGVRHMRWLQISYRLCDLSLLEAEFQKQKSVCHVTEGKQKMEDWLANRTYCSPHPEKILLLYLLLQKFWRELTEETFYSINWTIFNSFEQRNFKMKI